MPIKRLQRAFAALLPATLKKRVKLKFYDYRFRLHTQLGRSLFLLRLYHWFGVNEDLVVRRDTELVIEGAARTATTYAYHRFQQAQEHPVRVAYHIHLPIQVIRAAQLRVPVLITIRAPRAAVASAVIREPWMSVGAYLQRYRVFYEAIEPCLADCVLADFDEVTGDFAAVVARINRRFDCRFSLPAHGDEEQRATESRMIRRHREYGGGELQSYLPNQAKEEAKARISFSAESRLLARCEDIYQCYLQRIREND